MSKLITIIIFIVASFSAESQSQEVVITGFPLGIGSNIDQKIFQSYHSKLQEIADTLNTYPLTKAIITGCADGTLYHKNHDSQNPGLAIGRAHALRDYLISKFNVNKTQIVVQSTGVNAKGEQHRYTSVRIANDLSELESRLTSVEQQPPVETRITEVREISNVQSENMGLQFGAGLSSSPFGVIPILTGAITWKRFIFIEGVFGHTFWNDSFMFEDVNLDTWRRVAGGQVYIYPLSNIPVGIVGGWFRFEEISRKYNKYVNMSEGPVLGLRVTPIEYLSINGVYNPSNHNIAENILSELKSGQFFVFINFHIIFGGGK